MNCTNSVSEKALLMRNKVRSQFPGVSMPTCILPTFLCFETQRCSVAIIHFPLQIFLKKRIAILK